ncbi:MAG: aspartate aminotransferase family protein [Synechococcus sp. TMED187]|nr:aspartate aminotransferase family protein [Synechococcus sp. NAT40]OUW49650.1 MAG: aspartate aminotransferase family protein [Synechococcus sp. TMED187]
MNAVDREPLVGNLQPSTTEPLAPFASPLGLDPDLERFLHQASSQLCRWLGDAHCRGPLPMLSVLPDVVPEQEGVSSSRLLDDLQWVMDGAFQPSHPGALAHLDPPPLTASIAADLICAGLNNNLLAEELSPSLTRLERHLCNWFASRLGLPASAGGVPASGGSLSNLNALVVARHHLGLAHNPESVVLASADSHVSLAKAVRVMGLRPDALQTIPVDDDGCLDMDLLQTRLKTLRSQQRPCLAVVATAGTTVRGAIDPLRDLANFCRREQLWLHVDGAIGAIFALSATTAPLLEGLGLADSITVNPQKLLGITKTSSLLLVADRSTLADAFATGLPYMEPAWGDGHGGEQGLQGTRPAEVLKLWLGLRQLGENGIASLLTSAVERRQSLETSLDASQLQVCSGPLHLLACRPLQGTASEIEAWSLKTRQRLLNQQLMLSRPIYAGFHYLKAVLGNPHTQSCHLRQLAEILNASAREFA